MAAVAAASAPRLASAAASSTRRHSQRLQLLPEGRRRARTPRKHDDAEAPMSAATSATSAATSATSSTASSTAKDSDDPEGVLFFAYGALMDPAVIQGRLLGREAGLPSRFSSSLSPRAAVAVAFAERGGGGRRRQRRQKREEQASSSVAVAFAHRGGWATLVDLGDARASAASPLWRLVPGSPRGEEERGGGWSAREGERGERASAREGERGERASGGDTESETSFIGGPCFSSPAHGVLYSLSSDFYLEALAAKEGGYSLRKVEVRVVPLGDGDGGKQTTPPLEAFAFVSSPGLRLRFPLPPRQKYLEKMRRGARAAGLGDEYGAWLDRVPCSGEGPLDGRYQATPAGAAAAAAGVALFAAVVELLI